MKTVRDELHTWLLEMKQRRIAEGELAEEVVGETAAELLITAHLMALKIGITRADIIVHLDGIIGRLAEDMN